MLESFSNYTLGTTVIFTLFTDMFPNNELNSLVSDIQRVFSQLDNFIESFNTLINNNALNVVFEEGRIGVDTSSNISWETAQQWATRVSVYHDLIHDRCHNLEYMLWRLIEIESSIEDLNYDFKYPELLDKFLDIVSKYRHFY